ALFDINQKAKMLDDDSSFSRATDVSLANCDATYSYKIVANSLNSKREFTITSIGKAGRAEETVYAEVILKGLFENAILVRSRLSLMPNTLVAGYNSGDPTDTDIDVQVGTTSTEADSITLGPGTVVDGDIFAGVGGDPSVVIGPGGTVTGERFALTEEIDFPVITPPALPVIGTGISAVSTTVRIGPEKSGQYTEINLSGGSGSPGILEIDGGEVVLHVTGNIDIGNSSEIVVRPGSSLVLYLDGDMSAGNSAGIINESPVCTALKVFATGDGEQTFELKAKSKILGLVYAPNANIDLYPGAELHGAITANKLWLKSGANFFYDEAVREVELGDEGVRFEIARWWE
ncbi:MAG: hypothetical protein KAY65_13760, partial [Planctomycetes bacterium]|nr:hypothetical protein [Planctomycetota bacterium]